MNCNVGNGIRVVGVSPVFWLRIILDSKPNHPKHTVDGRNPAPVDMVNIPSFTRFYTSQMVQDFFHQQYHWPKQRIVLYIRLSPLVPDSLLHNPKTKNQSFGTPKWTSRGKKVNTSRDGVIGSGLVLHQVRWLQASCPAVSEEMKIQTKASYSVAGTLKMARILKQSLINTLHLIGKTNKFTLTFH